MRNSALQIASAEQKKADVHVLRLDEEQMREKEAALKKILELERDLNAKQKLEMEIEELKGKLELKVIGTEVFGDGKFYVQSVADQKMASIQKFSPGDSVLFRFT